MNFKRIDEAVRFATKSHEGQYRRSERVLYISHPYTAALYLLNNLIDTDFPGKTKEDLIIAALLHDVWEDTGHSLKEIKQKFGQEVADLVEGASEPDKSLPWQQRKDHTITYLKTAPLEVRYVICADKTHNVVSLLASYKEQGDKIWEHFKKGAGPQEWYYKSIADALVTGFERVPPFFENYRQLVKELFDDQ